MLDDHWFDNLNKALVRDFPRRTLPQTAVAVVAGLALGVAPAVDAAKKRRKRKRKGKGKDKGLGQEPRCGQAACQTAFATDEAIDACQIECGRCQRTGTDFCIHDPVAGRPEVHPTCCPPGEECCGVVCCGPEETSTCCRSLSGPALVSVCVAGRVDCCDDDPAGWCDPDTQRCCPGVGCVNGTECPAPGGQCGETCLTYPTLRCCDGDCVNITVNEAHCGGCNQTCFGPNLRCCGGDCVDLMNDLDNCGACGLPCGGPPGPGVWTCCDGDCKGLHNDEENCGACGETCIGPGLACCSSTCVNTLTDADHCGRCNNRDPDFQCCSGRLYDPDVQFCCDPFAGPPCFHGQFCCTTDAGLPGCCNPDPPDE